LTQTPTVETGDGVKEGGEDAAEGFGVAAATANDFGFEETGGKKGKKGRRVLMMSMLLPQKLTLLLPLLMPMMDFQISAPAAGKKKKKK